MSDEDPPLDAPLQAIGFRFDVVSGDYVAGLLTVSDICCQPYGMLHGGVSALIAEALASIGAQLAAGEDRRIVGVQLSINHHRSARTGDCLLAEATPAQTGSLLQIWDGRMWKVDDESTSAKGVLVASSTVTILEKTREVPPEVAKIYQRHATKNKISKL
ncbi:1,4-dihydroxy-2-naphthoyl-CoA thioesterase 1-like [Zingiber officinale]|uniref:Thioesterase domain-containing protein n=1 Tax=Zingiber officinale TaxID=94328 RepID=A0A8J5FPP5_ZINOF|nr:1,4-dihydroxy-2-naphthoyl-CoA thioesterase 1-like [Zingiber officinale]KAG6493453.1 hypothetical protein ZIOFF_048439 [Zingiber officinale]